MKKLAIVALCILLMGALAGCQEDAHFDGETVSLPLRGLLAPDGEIFVHYDPMKVNLQSYTPGGEGYAVDVNGDLRRLKKYTRTLSLPSLYEENKTVEIPMVYFIHNDRLYPYVDSADFTGGEVMLLAYPNSTEEILLSGTCVKEVKVYNLQTGKLRNLVPDEEKSPTGTRCRRRNTTKLSGAIPKKTAYPQTDATCSSPPTGKTPTPAATICRKFMCWTQKKTPGEKLRSQPRRGTAFTAEPLRTINCTCPTTVLPTTSMISSTPPPES